MPPYVQVRRLPGTKGIRSGAQIARVGQSVQIPLPEDMTRHIAIRAQRIVRRTAPRSTWLRPGKRAHGADLLKPDYGQGEVGIFIPSDAIHMLYQDQGIQPFVMWWAEGRTIPIRGPDGVPHFVKAVGVGKRTITARDSMGRILGSRIRWRHPGLAPKNFIDRAIRQAAEVEVQLMGTSQVLDVLEAFAGRPIPRTDRGV